jgi:hypothetical protein
MFPSLLTPYIPSSPKMRWSLTKKMTPKSRLFSLKKPEISRWRHHWWCLLLHRYNHPMKLLRRRLMKL